MSGTNQSVRSYVDRILSIMSDIDAKGDDKKEIYKELANEGYDRSVVSQLVGHLRKKAKKPGKFAEQSALFDTYLAAYEGTGTVLANAHAAREALPDHNPETGEVLDTSSTAARKDVQSGPDAHRHARLRPKSGPAGTQAPPVDTSSQGLTNLITPSAGTGGEEDRQPIQALEASETGEFEEYPSGGSGTAREASGGKRTEQSEMRGLEEGPEVAPPTNAREGAPADEAEPTQVEASSVPRKRQWKHSDPPHRDCLDPGQCGGFSNLGLCQRCKDAAA